MAKKKPVPVKPKSKPKPAPKPVPFVAKQSKVASKIYNQYPDRFKNYGQARAAASKILQGNNNKTRGLTDKKLDYGIRGWTKSQPKPKPAPKPVPFVAKQSKIASKIYEQYPNRFENYGQARKAATFLLHGNNDSTRGLKDKVLDYGLRKFKREEKAKEKPVKGKPGIKGQPVPKKRKRGEVLTEINQHASQLYKEHPEWFEDYQEAQKAAADIIKGKYGDIEGIEETKFEDAVGRWRDKNIPEEPEEELSEEPPRFPMPDVPSDLLTNIDYYDLDDRFQTLQKHIQDELRKDSEDPLKTLGVQSPLLREPFDAIDFNYHNTFKEYVDWMNANGYEYWRIKFTLTDDDGNDGHGPWYILVDEDQDENGDHSGYAPSTAEGAFRRISPVEKELGRREPKVVSDERLSETEKREKLDNLVNQREFLRGVKEEKQNLRVSQLKIIADLRNSKDKQELELIKALRFSNVELSKQIDELSRQEAQLTRRIGVK
jgi:hypothetical protein